MAVDKIKLPPIVILCGGKGTRVKKLLKKKNIKPLLSIHGKPFLHYKLLQLKKQGFSNFILSTNFKSHLIKNFIKKFKINKKININLIKDKHINTGTGGALKNIAKFIKQPFFVTYADNYLRLNCKKFYSQYKLKSSKIMMSIFKNKDNSEKNNISILNKKVIYKKSKNANAKFIDYGIFIIDPVQLMMFKGNKFDLECFLNAKSLERKIDYFKVYKKFYEIGSLKGFKSTKKFLKK